MKKTNSYKSFICLLALTLFICSAMLFLCYTEHNKAYADYVTDIQTISNVIVNYNQLWDPTTLRSNYSNISFTNKNGLIVMNGTNSNGYDNTNLPISDTTINLISNHKYYMRYNFVGTIPTNLYLGLISGSSVLFDISTSLDGIYTSPSTQDIKIRYGVLHTTNYNVQFYVYLIDLTLMFGSNDNVPNLDQCRELFVSDYYPYSLGTAVSYDNLDAWADGYSTAINNLNVIFSGTLLQSNCYANIGTLYTLSEYNSIGMRIDNTRQLSEFYFNYPTALSKGDVVSLKFENLDINLGDNENNPFSIQIGYYSNGEFIVITSFNPNNSSLDRTYWFEGAYNGIYKNAYVSFNAPDNMQRIYFRTTHKGYAIRGLEINAKTSNTAFNLSTAQQRGWDLAEEYYTNYYNEYYSQGGEGYTQIYQAGYQNGNNGGNVFLDSWEWVGSLFTGIGNILTLQIVPGLPLGIFVALPLLVGLIFFIVKISKG